MLPSYGEGPPHGLNLLATHEEPVPLIVSEWVLSVGDVVITRRHRIKGWILLMDGYVFNPTRCRMRAWRFAVIALGVVLTIAPPRSVRAGEVFQGEKAMATLRVLATHAASNLDSIKTWKAEYQYTLAYSHGERTAAIAAGQAQAADLLMHGPISQEDSGRILLSYSAKLDAFSCLVKNETPPRIVDLSGKKRGLADQLAIFHQHAIVTPDRFLHFMPEILHAQSLKNPVGDGTPTRMAFRDPLADSAGREWTDLVNPRALFSMDDVPFHIWLNRFPKFYEKATLKVRKTYDDSISIEKQTSQNGTDRYIMKWNAAAWTKVIQFPQESGYLPTEYATYARDGEVLSDYVWEYIASGNSFVPKTLTRETFANATSDATTKHTLRLASSSLNKPIDESEFTVSAFGLKDGERFLDRVNGKLWVSKGGKLVDVASYNASLQAEPR